MKNKSSKILVISILMILTLLILGSNVKAMVDGFYTKADISWHSKDDGTEDEEADTVESDGGWITVKDKGYFYCRNHGYNLTGKLLREPIDNPARLSIDNWTKSSDFDKEINEFKDEHEEKIQTNNTVLELTFGNPVPVKDTLEAAFYAFADHYCENPSKYVQSSLWYFLSKNSNYLPKGESSNPGNRKTLNNAAEYYATTWLENNKADLKISTEKAKVRINGNDYIAGPFTVDYNEKEFSDNKCKINFSEITEHLIKDQNDSPIKSAKLTNEDGTKEFKEIPNGKPFYVKFPYSDTITELRVYGGVKYIDTVEATKTDVKTQAKVATYHWEDIEDSQYSHSSACSNYNNGNLSKEDSCSFCEKQEYNTGSTEGTLQYQNINTPYQNMRRFEGKVNFAIAPIKITLPIIPPETPKPEPEEMDLAGYVWEDMLEGKAQKPNGRKDNNDKALAGIEVRLYDITKGGLAKVYKSTNPVLTDAKGHYEFKGVDPTHKYYVEFRYDGMLYTNTYGAGKPEYNTDKWNATSKGSEVVSERNALNERFKTISSYPASYKSDPIFGDPNTYLTKVGDSWYNKIYSITDVYGGIVPEYKKKVADALQSYLNNNKVLSDHNQTYFDNVYWPIIRASSNQTEAKQVLQYIWDSTVKAYAGYESIQDGKTQKVGKEHYPVYDKFALTDEKGNRITANNATTQYNGYRIIYNGQLYINLGLIRRPTTDLELTEDLYQAIVSINGQDEKYKFNTFSKKGVKITDISHDEATLEKETVDYYKESGYYNNKNAQIEQNVAAPDYNYSSYAKDNINSKQSSDFDGTASYPEGYAPIQMYVTYRINIKNNSSMPTSVNEIVSYLDSNYYSYSDSYETTGGVAIPGITGSFITPNGDTTVTENELKNVGLKVNEHSKYGTDSETGSGKIIAETANSESDINQGTRRAKDLYISLDNEVILENNQTLAVYVTYRLGENSTTHSKFNCTYSNPNRPNDGNHAYTILQDVLGNGQKVYIYTRGEINAYSTFYNKNDDPQGTQGKYGYSYTSPVQSGQYRAAGVFDALSMPGNLDNKQIVEFESTTNSNTSKSENDWDRASVFVIQDPNAQRQLTGNVWETVGKPANYWLENKDNGENAYPKFDSSTEAKDSTFDSSTGAKDITVELIEIKNGNEHVRARTKTNADGSYTFRQYIPGKYTVRFIYGDTAKYDTEQHSQYTTFKLNGYEYKCAYNGQFYQSGRANPKTNDNKYWYAVENERDIRYSDAYDEVDRRIEVNNLLNTYKYSDVLDVLKHPTDYMVYAYTSLLDIEVEYAKKESVTQNPAYTISNIDFALTPRTKSELKLNKEVTHIKLILQNGTVQFDADTSEIREKKVPAVVQAAQGNDINISMSSEIVNGATLEITYKITITNVSPKDTITYYTDSQIANGDIAKLQQHAIALGFYEEDPTKLVYYEDKIRKYDNYIKNSNGDSVPRFIIQDDETLVSLVETGKTSMKEYNIRNKQTIETTTRAETVADYISNNLTFGKQSYTGAIINETWDLVTMPKEEFDTLYYRQKQSDEEKRIEPVVKESESNEDKRELDASEVYDSNMIVVSNEKNPLVTTDLKHKGEVSEYIVLSKVISVNDNSSDKKSYMNRARIVEINNIVSRVQDMAADGLIHKTERVIISDPTGIGNMYLGIVLVLVVTVIIGSGIILIKKFVIKK